MLKFRDPVRFPEIQSAALTSLSFVVLLLCGRRLESVVDLVAASASLLLFLLLAVRLRQLLSTRAHRRTLSSIEQQLNQLPESMEAFEQSLFPLNESTRLANSWNRLHRTINEHGAIAVLESRIAERFGGQERENAAGVLNGLGEGIAITDPENRIVTINEALVSLLKLDAEADLKGESMESVLKPLAQFEALSAAVFNPSVLKPITVEFESSTGDGQIYQCARRPRMTQLNRHEGFVWAFRDVTQQKLVEKSREDFVSMATHELRTPLANIRAYAETLAVTDGVDTRQQKAFCNTILSESIRLARFVDELLDITRMQSGSLTLDCIETDLEKLFIEVRDKISGQATAKSQTLQVSLPAKFPKAFIDRDKIVATVVNLLGNAVKYTPEYGTVKLEVANRENELEIAVEDNGIGIANSELSKVFDKFFRSDDDNVRRENGSGLGLSLSQEVVRLHGGDIEVQSELGKGSRFTIRLPLQGGAAVR